MGSLFEYDFTKIKKTDHLSLSSPNVEQTIPSQLSANTVPVNNHLVKIKIPESKLEIPEC